MGLHRSYILRAIGICSLLHFLVDALCVCCLYLLAEASSVQSACVVGAFMTYNVLAFLTQPLTGWHVDCARHKHWTLLVSTLLLLMAVLLALFTAHLASWRSSEVCFFAVASLLGLGNSLFHVWGGKQTALVTGNDIRALGTFVSTGAFGLAVGILFHSWPLLFVFLLAICALALAYVSSDRPASGDAVAPSAVRLPFSLFLTFLFMGGLVTFVLFRSYLGQSFSVGSGNGGAIVLLVGAVSMLGKMAGGWMSKWWGLVPALVVMLMGTSLCLLFRTAHPVLPLVGLFMINCTMPVTLYLANEVLRGREGLAFGLLAAALMPGYLLAFV